MRAFIYYLAILLLPLAYAEAATFGVNTEADLDGSDNRCTESNTTCSLRAAIQRSNQSDGLDSITLPAGTYNLSLTGTNEDAAATGDLDITDDLIINGAGANQVFIDGLASDKIFQIAKGVSVIINGVTLRNGVADGVGMNNNNGSGGFGGAIFSEGHLTINDSNLDRNAAFNGGGGIYAIYRGHPIKGSLEINRSNLTRNGTNGGSGGSGGHIYAEGIPIRVRNSVIKESSATSIAGMLFGGGIYYADSTYPPLESYVINTTISDNRVMSYGGGIYVGIGTLNIENSTISGNASYTAGGGLAVENSSTVNITFSTIAFNSAPTDGGINGTSAALTLSNSIVSDNINGNCSSSLNSGGRGNLDNDGSCGFNLSELDPLLLPLTDNGGPNLTHALGEGSPALLVDDGETGDISGSCLVGFETDQRSYTRPTTHCDLGALEKWAIPADPPISTPEENNEVTPIDDEENNAPVAYDLPAAVIAGGLLHGIMNAYDSDGDPLTYEITSQPTKGNVGSPVPGSSNDIPGGYTYAARATATGSDWFTFRACDPLLACSEEKRIYITITSGSVSDEIYVELTPSEGNVNDLVIVSEAELAAIAPDTDYTYPNGAYFFSVDDVPATAGRTEVTVQLSDEATIPVDAKVRKLDKNGDWRNLSSVPSSSISSAVIDSDAKTITLTLIDNDNFDLNPEIGIINDPVALAVFTPTSVTCEPGSYGTTTCVEAEPGFHVPTAGATSQTPCDAGTYSDTAGAVSCTDASPGYFVALSQSSAQEACPAGHYSANAAATECTPATKGHFVGSAAQSSQAQCVAGTYSSSTASTSCTDASLGHYVPEAAAIEELSCAAGTYAEQTKQTSCQDAAPGYFVASEGQSAQTACPVGKYSEAAKAQRCALASLGHFVASAALSTQTECAVGSYADEEGLSQCKSAQVGFFVASSAQSSQTACSPGHYSDTTGADACTAASVGHFVALAGQSKQTACPIGHYSDSEGATECTSAPLETYVDSVGASAVSRCPSGTTTKSTGSTSASDCVQTNALSSPAASENGGGGGGLVYWPMLLLIFYRVILRRYTAPKL